MCEICDKKIWNKKYERLIKYLFKMKDFNQLQKRTVFQWKGTFA